MLEEWEEEKEKGGMLGEGNWSLPPLHPLPPSLPLLGEVLAAGVLRCLGLACAGAMRQRVVLTSPDTSW